jgi:HlyD family secretion protein
MRYLANFRRKTAFPLLSLAVLVAACNRKPEADAYGTFEATEVVVASQTTGQIERFIPVEGMQLQRGAIVAVIDTTQLSLERRQLLAERNAASARSTEATRQIGVLLTQREIARRAYERTRRLFSDHAATAQQLDQAERDYRVLLAQIEAARAQARSVALNVRSTDARVAQIADHIVKSTVTNPQPGTVLTTYARAGEVVQSGQPLYKIADLDTLVLRAYVSESQLSSVRIGQQVSVRVDRGGSLLVLPGRVTWVAAKAEFTPTPIQTRDERADLVYAVKILVPNRDGSLKIGMPGDVTLSAPR